MSKLSPLNVPLLRLSDNCYWNVSDACRHTFILGDSGSGKSSGSGATLRRALLKNAAAGGLVLVCKPEEAESVRRDCKAAGRLDSLIELNGRNGHAFNFLQYELARLGEDGINSVVECIMRADEAAQMASGPAGKSGDQFWEQMKRMLLRHSLPVILAATGTVTIPDIIEFVRTAPRMPEEMHDAQWQQRSTFFKLLMASEHRMPREVGQKILSFWMNEFSALDPKTKSNCTVSLTTTLDRFCHGFMQHIFCGETTFVPELCWHGAIIMLDLPALTLNEDGIIAQILFKFIWQRAMLARNRLPEAEAGNGRLCVLWVDEYQVFSNTYDPQFLSACRASNVATVLLSQSLPTLYASMPGENARDKVDHLVGMCATKIIHSTSCTITAKWVADMLGRRLHQRANFSAGDSTSENMGTNMGLGENWGGNSGTSSSFGGSSQDGKYGSNWSVGRSSGSSWGANANYGRNRGTSVGRNTSLGWSQQMDHAVEPSDLGRMLRTGGKANGGMVDGFFYQSGRVFNATGTNYLYASFRQ
jgi:hypothetical protein